MSDRILVRFDADEGSRLINRLAVRRQAAFEALEALRLALADLHGKDPTRPQIEEFLNCESERDAKTLALKIWIDKSGGTPLPFDAGRAVDVLTIPAIVEEVAAAWKQADGISKDPWRYWSDSRQAFKQLPVTNKEQGALNEACKFYAANGERAEMAKAIGAQVALINFSNQHGRAGIDAARLERLYPHLVPWLAVDKKIRHPNGGHHFIVKWSAFLLPGERAELFED